MDTTANVERTPHPLQGVKVVIAEDDTLLARLLGRRLSDAGGTLFHDANGTRILDLVKTEHPDIVVLDIMLPGMNGYDVLKTIKSDSAIAQTPVLLLSNLGQEEDLEKSKKLGAADFLIKATVSLDEVVDKILEIIHKTKKI